MNEMTPSRKEKPPFDWSRVIGEQCQCDHRQSSHAPSLQSGQPGHGPCTKCWCQKYRWVKFILRKETHE